MLILKWGRLRGWVTCCTLVLEVEENFMRVRFFEKLLNNFDLFFHPLIMEFFWFAKLPFRVEEKIHTKAVADVSRGLVDFWSDFPLLDFCCLIIIQKALTEHNITMKSKNNIIAELSKKSREKDSNIKQLEARYALINEQCKVI